MGEVLVSDKEWAQDFVLGTPQAYQRFFEVHGESCYCFCFRLCLESASLAQQLFENSILGVVNKKGSFAENPELLFYRQLHKQWPAFCRFRSELKAKDLKTRFDWHRPLGQQDTEALRGLMPREREVVLHRFQNSFNLAKIAKIFAEPPAAIVSLYQQAMNKMVT